MATVTSNAEFQFEKQNGGQNGESRLLLGPGLPFVRSLRMRSKGGWEGKKGQGTRLTLRRILEM